MQFQLRETQRHNSNSVRERPYSHSSPTMSEEEQTPGNQPPAEESLEAKDEEEQDWGDDITEEKNGGLFKKILTPGPGSERPLSGDEVYVHYTGRLLNGDVFDSSVERGELFKFKLSEGQVIKGWDEGVATMTRGEKCILTCKPEYAYGENGSPPKIPPDSTLRFEVELFDWNGEDITGAYVPLSPVLPGLQIYPESTDFEQQSLIHV